MGNLNTDYSKIMNRGNSYNKIIGDDNDWDFRNADHFDCKEQIWWGADYYRQTLPRDGSWFVWDKQISDHDGLSHTGSLFELAWSKYDHKREIIKVPWFRFYGWTQAKDYIQRKNQFSCVVGLSINLVKLIVLLLIYFSAVEAR